MSEAGTKLWHLENINILHDFSAKELEEIDNKSRLKAFKKKVNIYFPDDPANVVYLLKSGRVKIGTYGDNGKEIIKNIIYPGEIFGELSIVGKKNRTDFAIALDKDVKLCTIPRDEMIDILEKIPRLQLRITKVIGDRVIEMDRKFNSLIFSSSEDRVIDFLKDMAAKIGTKVGDETLVKHNLSHEEIGKLSCTSRQTVTTILNELKKKDLIHLERKKVLIRNVEKLSLS